MVDLLALGDYLSPVDPDLWVWDEKGETVQWASGTTIGFREEFAAVLSQIETTDLGASWLPPFGAVVLLVAACRGEPSGLGQGRSAKRRRTPCRRNDGHGPTPQADRVSRQSFFAAASTREDSSAAGECRTSLKAKSAMAAEIFSASKFRVRPAPGGDFLPSLRRGKFKPALAHLSVAALAQALSTFEVETWPTRFQIGIDEPPPPAEEIELPETNPPTGDAVRKLIDTLREDGEFAAMAAVARDLLGRRTSAAAGFGARGTADRRRLRHLQPRLAAASVDRGTGERRLHAGDANRARRSALSSARGPAVAAAGRPHSWCLTADCGCGGRRACSPTSVGLALAATTANRGEWKAFRAEGSEAVPIDLGSRAGLVEHLSRLSPHLSPLGAFQKMYEEATTQAVREVVLITSEDAAADPVVRREPSEGTRSDAVRGERQPHRRVQASRTAPPRPRAAPGRAARRWSARHAQKAVADTQHGTAAADLFHHAVSTAAAAPVSRRRRRRSSQGWDRRARRRWKTALLAQAAGMGRRRTGVEHRQGFGAAADGLPGRRRLGRPLSQRPGTDDALHDQGERRIGSRRPRSLRRNSPDGVPTRPNDLRRDGNDDSCLRSMDADARTATANSPQEVDVQSIRLCSIARSLALSESSAIGRVPLPYVFDEKSEQFEAAVDLFQMPGTEEIYALLPNWNIVPILDPDKAIAFPAHRRFLCDGTRARFADRELPPHPHRKQVLHSGCQEPNVATGAARKADRRPATAFVALRTARECRGSASMRMKRPVLGVPGGRIKLSLYESQTFWTASDRRERSNRFTSFPACPNANGMGVRFVGSCCLVKREVILDKRGLLHFFDPSGMLPDVTVTLFTNNANAAWSSRLGSVGNPYCFGDRIPYPNDWTPFLDAIARYAEGT